MTDDYELLPSEEVEYLRKEIEKIKAKPFGADTDTLIGSIRQLQSSIDALVKIFAEANNIISKGEVNAPQKTTSNDPGVLSRLELQNEKIARSIINLASNIKKQEEDHRKEYQDYLKKKEIKPRPQTVSGVSSGIAPSGLAPLSNAPKHEIEENKVNKEESNFPISSETIMNKPKTQESIFPLPEKNNDEELPEPPRPIY